ncbi:hypothetical protein OC834_002673 [Tilletia horrida]|uniref:Uncharacterized protein n=1 Tax=Tilletia horrida TaxID=155126 RepID=A0AAN6GBC4_9BASI|nr:hypothetical protein OC842_004814 [Tilletia horrida]KAK0532244.1 hypothetical protein OC834_002673 [Tilletia horrida]
MAATQRQYPPFVRQAQANASTKLSAVSKDGKMTPAQQDRQIFVIAGELLYGTRNIYTAGLALDKLRPSLTDDEHESNTAQKTRRTSSSSTASKRKATASDCETGSPTSAQRPAKEAKESAQAAPSASKSARPAARPAARPDARPAARKAATKKKVNHLLPKANPRPLYAAERRQVREAQCLEDEAGDAQDDEFSEDENSDHGEDDSGSEDDYVPHYGQPSDDEEPPSDPPQPSDVKPLPIEPVTEETRIKYFRFLFSKKVTKSRRNTDELYTDIDEKWLCLLCERKDPAHPNSKSNLYLHLNAKSNRNHCKHLYKPKDSRFVGHFTPPPPDAPDDDDESGPSPSGSKSGSVVSTVRQKKLDGWVEDQEAVGLKAKIEEVRRLILECMVMDDQPFTTAKRPRFQAILLALNPGVGPAMMSARQLRRDLDAAHSSTVSQLVAHIINNNIAFTISHDA